jgi:hypothetical protein
VLNLDVPGRAIGGRKLTEKTLANIREGIDRIKGEQFLLGYYNHPLFRGLDEPVGTITTVDRWALVTPALSWQVGRAQHAYALSAGSQGMHGFS